MKFLLNWRRYLLLNFTRKEANQVIRDYIRFLRILRPKASR